MYKSTQAILDNLYMNFGHIIYYKTRIIDNFWIFTFWAPLANPIAIFTPLRGKIWGYTLI